MRNSIVVLLSGTAVVKPSVTNFKIYKTSLVFNFLVTSIFIQFNSIDIQIITYSFDFVRS